MIAIAFLLVGCATARTSSEIEPDATPPIDAPAIDASVLPVAAAVSPVDAAPSGPGFFVDDEVQDFVGATLREAVVAPWGAIEPVAYYNGGLRASASDSGTLVSGLGGAWVDIEAMSFTGVTNVVRGLDHDWGTGVPTGLGLTSGDTWTIAFTGEMYLTAGTWRFHFLVDDHGFLEFAEPGTASFARLISSDNAEISANFSVGSDGWYPVRIAISEDAGGGRMRLQATPPGGARGPVSRDLLRARVDGVTGLYMAAFDDSYQLGGHASPSRRDLRASVRRWRWTDCDRW